MPRAARRGRRLAAALNAVAGVVLLVSVVLNERAVRAEGVTISDPWSYALGAAALLAFAAGWLALRSSSGERARGIGAPLALTVFMVVIALLGAYVVAISPVLYNIINGACLAEGSQTMFGAGVSQGSCGNVIQPTDFPLFYPSAVVAGAGAALGVAAAVLLIRARTRRDQAV